MSADDAAARLGRAASTARASGQSVILIMALTVPHDQTVFGVFSAASAEDVIQTCQRAGCPPDRVSTDVQPWLAPTAS